MLDNLTGRPSATWRRRETLAILSLSLYTLATSSRRGPKILWVRRLNRHLQQFSPWQILFGTLSVIYALRNFDKLFGLDITTGSPHHYSPEYFRATWISTALDCGFATAMSIRSLWLRQLSSVLFSLYYLVHDDAADAKLRRLREHTTLDIMRATWNKTTNPYLRLLLTPTLPPLPFTRKLTIPRPSPSPSHPHSHAHLHTRPITAHLFFPGPPSALLHSTSLILDFPGGGFVAMTPAHHEERLRMWAVRTGRPVLAVEYGKAPEYPFPYAIYECFDAYRSIVESRGRVLGMSGHNKLDIIISGDSAGGNIAVNVMFMILESERHSQSQSLSSHSLSNLHTLAPVPRPIALALAYPALNFAFSSWAWPTAPNAPSASNASATSSSSSTGRGVQVGLQPTEAETQIKADADAQLAKDVLYGEGASMVRPHIGPFKFAHPRRRTNSSESTSADRGWAHWMGWKRDKRADRRGASREDKDADEWMQRTQLQRTASHANSLSKLKLSSLFERQQEAQALAEAERERERVGRGRMNKMRGRGYFEDEDEEESVTMTRRREKVSKVTKVTMSSRTGYINDRIISPGMMWAMAMLYLGSNWSASLEGDYRVSPVLAPDDLLAGMPRVLMQCGGRDPLVDDTMLFAGRVREAKRRARVRMEREAKRRRDAKAEEGVRETTGDGDALAEDTLDTLGDEPGDVQERMKRSLRIPVVDIPSPPASNSSCPSEPDTSSERIGTFAGPGGSHHLDHYEDHAYPDEENEDHYEDEHEEDDDDGLTVQIFKDWSHGYLQMAAILPEAKTAINDIADWMYGEFERAAVAGQRQSQAQVASGQ